ncbi:acyl-CoA dehydrogenase domain-containing protein [Neobacillus bataviensis LMG 21833]|uniref:Acyl-CoA dehydrogenase domain-containing protein n=1 Tax=Neobacillus bataviensis LMG 21833 TaxID=1117379 RepID=K6EDW7_9BACI|nr:acyl-CoA dehydrogenase family protein [Neobacillus bataviensis]EKN71671.1 acyl-CoA dehydrogenase domain-containing protein [Neobacillus bataviensis LMG 21833]
MFDFAESEEQKRMLAEATEIMEKYVYPNEKYMVPHRGLPGDVLKPLQQMVKEKGLWAAHLPKEIGGMGKGFVSLGLLSEVIGQSPIGPYVFGSMAPDAGNGEILWHAATAEQKSKYLQPLADGEIRSCFGMTEPEVSGSDPTTLQGIAVKEGNEWIINAHKWYTTGAVGAAFCIAMVVTDPDAEKHKRTSLFIVDTDNPGFEIVREVPVMGDHYPGGHCEVRFNDCRVPEISMLGNRGEGFKLAQLRLGPGRITHAMRWLGVARRALNEMISFSLQKKEGDKTLADSQTVQNFIADSEAEIQAARLLTIHAAWKMDQGDQARKEVSLIKFYGANVLNNVLDRAIQTLGMYGLTPHTLLEELYREARAARIYDGADEVHRMVVARQALKEFQAKEQLNETASIPK